MKIGSSFVATPEQVAAVDATIDDFVAKHPPVLDKNNPFNPYYALAVTAMQTHMNPMLSGLFLDELAKKDGGLSEQFKNLQ